MQTVAKAWRIACTGRVIAARYTLQNVSQD